MRGVWVTAAVAALVASSASADLFSTKSRTNLFKSQTKILDTRAKNQYNSSVRLQPPIVATPTKRDVVIAPKSRGRY